MFLLVPSLLFFVYATFSLVQPLPWPMWGKRCLGLVVLAVSLKYFWYGYWGGSMFTPTLPRPLLLVMEALYAALLLFCVLLLCRDVLRLLLFVARHIGVPVRPFFAPSAVQVGLLAAFALALGCWGAWQSVRVPAVRTVEITLPRLPVRLDGLTMVQLTDLHIHTLLDRNWLRAVVERANSCQPDLILLTGDVGDKLAPELADDMEPLRDLQARYGVFGAVGNHEYYFHAEGWMWLMQNLGVTMLHNSHQALKVRGETLVIAGLADPVAKRFGGPGPDLAAALHGAPEAVRILLAHRPGGAEAHQGADVQLSGHTHGGQIFFLQPFIAAFNGGLVRGLYTLGDLQLYVSSGTGLWGGFSCRLGVPPEITRIILRAQVSAEEEG
ncbi:MAG: metallophosphoesterase [Desulfobulbus sp.]|jgi:predicted MPP superfamily phosphohydrolase